MYRLCAAPVIDRYVICTSGDSGVKLKCAGYMVMGVVVNGISLVVDRYDRDWREISQLWVEVRDRVK